MSENLPNPLAGSASLAAPARANPAWRYDAVFALLNLGIALLVFGKASLGLSLLAPLDIPARFCGHFQWLDPQAAPIPQNHWVVDVFDHELPRQYTIYQALRCGEFPWWDPYTDSGRPLVAEAHVSGTDPVRVALYYLLPFELAYNWSKISSSLLFGLGAYLLLRRRHFPGWINVGCALAYQFASNHFLYLTPLCVVSSFAYYGLLWWVWGRIVEGFHWGCFIAAGLLCGCIFLAGNLQTHACLALFALCFLLGCGFGARAIWKPLALGVAGSLAVGALLALPLLAAQVELFLLCQRPAAPAAPLAWLTGLANSSALFPWLMGTFRTPDAGKLFGQYGIGFSLYLGSAALILAAGGVVSFLAGKKASGVVRVAVLLVAAYEVICLTPLLKIFYLRSSDLAVLGLMVLSAEALHLMVSGELAARARQVMVVLSAACLGLFLLANVLALVVLPRLESRIASFVLSHDDQNAVVPALPRFRRFQVASLKRELGWRNPETVATALSVIALLCLLRAQRGSSAAKLARWAPVVLVLNLVPLALFAQRFVPQQPLQLWRRLLHEDSEQGRLASALGLQYRYKEPDAQSAAGHAGSLGHLYGVYPGATAHFYGVHHTLGYSSFQFPEVSTESGASGLNLADSDMAGGPTPVDPGGDQRVIAPPTSGTSRFQWKTPMARPVKVVRESLNRVSVEIAPGPPGVLVRTDRYYPGWRIIEPAGLSGAPLGRWLFAVEVPSRETRITFAYTPRFLSVTLPLSLLALAGCLGGALWGLVRRPGG